MRLDNGTADDEAEKAMAEVFLTVGFIVLPQMIAPMSARMCLVMSLPLQPPTHPTNDQSEKATAQAHLLRGSRNSALFSSASSS